ncbi:fumarylacetoacetate hydrolase family protein [Salinigranum marinum]|uniref:fumarylacetoacetate hydrolase family protein n=1 Tax=Salinigranum marinum TaxID=1515595 RepID=UPI00298A080C|nr:fumarylacetoacetate hydrolase family protein [Salinigranum marinum]
MRRVRFRDEAGSNRVGTLTEDGIEFGGQLYNPEDVTYLPPTEPSKIVCVGWNYLEHAAEKDVELPDRPSLFLKPPNALAAHGDTVTLPSGKDLVEYEAELGVIIDRHCRNVAEEDAMDVIRGFTCVNDISNRDDQNVEQNWVRGKAFDNSAPMGPVMATPEHVPDDARVTSRVNGETRQDSSIEHLIFSIPELVAEITSYVTLEPGDVVSTGTPEGVGPLSDGDHVEIEVEGVGTLEHDIRVV